MRSSIVNSVFHKELTELLRNRRSLIVMFGMPLLLYPILTIALASVQESKDDQMDKRSVRVALVSSDDPTRLRDILKEPDYNALPSRQNGADAASALAAGAFDAVIRVPRNYQADSIAGRQTDPLKLQMDSSRSSTPIFRKRLDKALDAYQQWIIQQRLAAYHVPVSVTDPPNTDFADIATSNQTFGVFLANALPVLLLLTGMLGALYPALSATTNERELGTLETLLVTPATRMELLTAKAGVVLISGLLTALLNMVSMSMVLWRVLSATKTTTAGFTIDPQALALSYLAAVPTLIFFTALVLMVGLIARNLREANAYATPLMMVPITSMLIGIADPAMTPGLLVTPVANTTLIIRAVLTGHATFWAFALAFVSSGLYAGLVLSLAGRLFTNEQLVNPAWEPLSLRGFGRRRPRQRRWPAIDEALTLFAFTVLLNFYVAPSWIKYGLIPLLFGVEILLIAAPAVLFAWLGRYPWREVFSLRRPTFPMIAASVFLGIGMIPLMNGMSQLQQHWHILPQNKADMEGMSELFEPVLLAHPFLSPIIVGLLAGVCEELLFRGPIQAAFMRRLPAAAGLIVVGLLFAAAHLDLSGLIERAILGVFLGWIVWRGGSIFPAMLMHGVYDGVSVAWNAYTLTHHLGDPEVSALMLIVGLALSGAGWAWIYYDVLPKQIQETSAAP